MSREREQWAASVTSTHLEQDSDHEAAIDRIGAAAFGPALGRVLWRIRYAGETALATVAVQLLANKMRRRWSVPRSSREWQTVLRCCRQAVTEWFDPSCRTCRGAGEVTEGELRIVCPTCEGEGLHRYSDHERKVAVLDVNSPEPWDVWDRRLHEACSALHSEDTAVALEMRRQLERGGGSNGGA